MENPNEERFLIGADQYALDAVPTPAKPPLPPPAQSPTPAVEQQSDLSRPAELGGVETFKAKYKGMIPDADMPAAYQKALNKWMAQKSAERLAQGVPKR